MTSEMELPLDGWELTSEFCEGWKESYTQQKGSIISRFSTRKKHH